jgi:hypothetical protein
MHPSPHFDFSSYYLNEQLSDVVILVRLDGDVKQRIPGHGVVLANASAVFRRTIELQQGRSLRIALDVGPQQVSAAGALVRFIYTGVR